MAAVLKNLRIRTLTETRDEGLKVPKWAEPCVKPDAYFLVHDPDDGNLLVWGPDRDEVENLARAFD